MTRRFSIATKFFLTYFVITGAALAFAGIAGYVQFLRYAVDEADRNLESEARLVAEAFRPLLEDPEPDRNRIASEGDRLGRNLHVRLTVILPDGEVVADSFVGAERVPGLENHATRPEFRDALAGRAGVAQRRSGTLGVDMRYAAVPVLSTGRVVGAARTALPAALLRERLNRIRTITWGTGIVAFLLMLAGTAFRAKHVTGPLREMREAANELAAGTLSRRVRIRTGDELEEMAAALNRTAAQLEETIRLLDTGKTRLSTLLENLAEGVLVITGDRTVRMMNRGAGLLLGKAVTLREGQPYAEAIRYPEVLAFIDGWMRGESLPPRDVVVHLPTEDKTIRLSATRVRYADERGTDLLVTLRDVTEEKRLSRIKSDFVSNASHELRTPLTNIRGYLEALDDDIREGTRPDASFLSVALQNALRMEDLIDDLLELSRAESGHPAVEKEEILLPAFLDRVGALHREAAQKAGKTLEWSGEETPFRADVRKLTVAVSNLVDNAVKYGREGGRIRLAGRAAEGGVLIEVADDGPGISPEHLPRIFERFYRVDKGRSRDLGGTGLGLAIAKHIVESHGGTIRAESRIGVGTQFTIRLPAG